jgi:CDP-diacylglycerol--glycerol-3-phosphate 3-phosphatidyltransferase
VRAVVRLLAKTPVTPNAITVFGLGVTAAAAYVIATGGLFWGGVILLAGSALDALDGELARQTGRVSVFGAFLDSSIDRAQEGLLFMGVALYYHTAGSMWGVGLSFLALIGSYMVSYTRARAEGLGFKGEFGFMSRPMRIIFLGVSLLAGWPLPVLVVIALLSALTAVQRSAAVARQAGKK